MKTFLIIQQTKNRNAITSVEFEKDDKKVEIIDFLGYKITIEKNKGELNGKAKINEKKDRPKGI